MASLADTMAYILSRYPRKDELSNARLTKIVYLTDWVHALYHREQVTPIAWHFDNYGPFVWDVLDTAKENPDRFVVEYTSNYYGTPKALVQLVEPAVETRGLTDDEKKSVNHVIEQTRSLPWDGFIKLVYSTHPILTSERYTRLNLIEKADEYQARTGAMHVPS